jgi:hypothetical protein
MKFRKLKLRPGCQFHNRYWSSSFREKALQYTYILASENEASKLNLQEQESGLDGFDDRSRDFMESLDHKYLVNEIIRREMTSSFFGCSSVPSPSSFQLQPSGANRATNALAESRIEIFEQRKSDLIRVLNSLDSRNPSSLGLLEGCLDLIHEGRFKRPKLALVPSRGRVTRRRYPGPSDRITRSKRSKAKREEAG